MSSDIDRASVACEFQHDSTVNYAAQQNHVPVVERLRVRNSGVEKLGQTKVVITPTPEFAEPWEASIAGLPPGQMLDLGPVDLQLSAAFLAGLTEKIAGTLTITVSEGDVTLYSAQSPIDILAYDEWGGTRTFPEIIAAFVTPNHPEVSRIVRQAADFLGQWTGNPALDGYQSKDPNRVRHQLAAIYSAIQAREIAYCVPPASFEEQGQKIRTPDVLMQHRLGTCLDLAVLFSACAEAAGLHPLIIFNRGHAFAGTWLVEETFSESVQDDITLLTKRIALGVQEVCVLETTLLTAGRTATFEQAVAQGEANLRDPALFGFFVDVRRARASHIRPLPLRVAGQVAAEVENAPADLAGRAAAPELDNVEIISTPDTAESSVRTRLEQWERRLLDLSLRNTGIHLPRFFANRKSSLR